MNIQLRNISFFSFLLLIFFFQQNLFAQSFDPPVNIDVIEGQSYSYEYYHYGPPPLTTNPVFTTSHYGTVNTIQALGNKKYRLVYDANPNMIGQDTVTIFLRKQTGGNFFRTIYFNVVPSQIKAEDDFITVVVGQNQLIDVVANDFSNRGVLNLTDVSMENNGTTAISGNQVSFTPNSGFEGLANFNYVVCDDIGNCDKATVSVCVGDPYSYANDTLNIITIKDNVIPLFTPLNNYTLITGAANGTLDTINGTINYNPNQGYFGLDELIYQNNGTGFTKTVMIDVMDVDAPNNFVKDDVSYTFINEPKEINILENDYFGPALYNVHITSNPLNGNLNYIAKGYYIYQPNPGFEGVDEFTYSASPNSNGSNAETGVVSIIVSDQNPEVSVFELQTPKDIPLVIDYNIPLSDFDFVITNNAFNGTVEYYPGHLDTTIVGQNFKGDNLLIFYPNNNFMGTDSFEIEYCAALNTTCPTVKVIVEVQNVSSQNLCVGNDCVWPGDGNLDGKVDLRDLLPTGWCIGDVGKERQNSTISPWYGQGCDNWGVQFPHTGVDLKHLDANGDSLINVSDTLAIGQHYQKYHSLSPEPVNFPSNIPLFMGQPDTIHVAGPGDTVRIPIILGDPNLPALDMYGLTFSIDFDPSVINARSSNISFNKESWVSYTSPTLNMVKKPFEGRIDAGYTRTSGISSDGYGKIGKVDFVIIEDIIVHRLPEFIYARISGSYMNSAGNQVGIPESFVRLSIKGENTKDDYSRDAQLNSKNLMLFPNPAYDYLNYRMIDGGDIIGDIEVYDLTGKMIVQEEHQALNGQIYSKDFNSGIYVIRVRTTKGVVTRKFEVINK